jgi:hypothetical protein
MSKNAIIVTNINFEHVFEHTLPYFERYSKKTGADLIVIDSKSIGVNNTTLYQRNGAIYEGDVGLIYPNLRFENLQAAKYFDTYERILLVDCDVIIKPDCPDYFNSDPKNLYVSIVDLYSDNKLKRSIERIKSIKEQLGEIEGWEQLYFNSGVMMLSKMHSVLFEYDFEKLNNITGQTRIQSFYNWNARKNNLSIVDMGPRFNFPSHRSLINGVRREDAYIIHYTGPKQVGDLNYDTLIKDSKNYLAKKTII